MATNYPAALDNNTTLPNPSASSNTNNPSHAAQHANINDAVKAAETKVGIGSSTPASNTLLYGTGAGTSAWQGLTSAQLASILSDETGTGSAVFANTPTLITPKVDTINENTLSNGVTVGGVNLKSGALNTNNSVVTANITDANVTNPKLQNTGSFNSSWAWTSFTPTITNLTLGNGTSVGAFTQIGKTTHFRWTFTLGSTSSIGSVPTFTLPVAPTGMTANVSTLMKGIYWDVSGTTPYEVAAVYSSGSIMVLRVMNASLTYGLYDTMSATVPVAYGTGDILQIGGTYEAA